MQKVLGHYVYKTTCVRITENKMWCFAAAMYLQFM